MRPHIRFQVRGHLGSFRIIDLLVQKLSITMIAKVGDHKSRRDLWFKNRLVEKTLPDLFKSYHVMRFPIMFLTVLTFLSEL